MFPPIFLLQDENDVYILTKVSDILHSVFSSYNEKVLPWFEQLLQLIVQLIVSTSCICLQSYYISTYVSKSPPGANCACV